MIIEIEQVNGAPLTGYCECSAIHPPDGEYDAYRENWVHWGSWQEALAEAISLHGRSEVDEVRLTSGTTMRAAQAA